MNLRRDALAMFACPECEGALRLAAVGSEEKVTGEIMEGELACESCRMTIPVVQSLPRFVASESYASSFGFQWNRFDRIQVDKFMHNDLSRDRFYATTGWPMRLEGERILEAGCGSGRFTQLALETGAEVVSFDLSSAVDAAWRNNAGAPRLTVFQGSIYKIPLRKGAFDKIFCMGVLQHCPDVAGAFRSLLPFLRPGGEIVIDVYEKQKGLPPLKYWVRPFVRPLGTEGIYRLLSWTIPPAFNVKKALYRIPGVGPRLGALIPIGPISHAPRLIYTDEELKQVKILSALDMLSPAYDQPQRIEGVQRWFEEAGLVEVEIKRGYNGINAKGKRANGSAESMRRRIPA
ncbi:MAG TPA: class I SAM-dependent methyltransferase [Candidatus Sulfotelmatobacter sp.]|nr:class I SAM-dependent methyltransferase [Candidatus Sulfotelmatobacter sp.]